MFTQQTRFVALEARSGRDNDIFDRACFQWLSSRLEILLQVILLSLRRMCEAGHVVVVAVIVVEGKAPVHVQFPRTLLL